MVDEVVVDDAGEEVVEALQVMFQHANAAMKNAGRMELTAEEVVEVVVELVVELVLAGVVEVDETAFAAELGEVWLVAAGDDAVVAAGLVEEADGVAALAPAAEAESVEPVPTLLTGSKSSSNPCGLRFLIIRFRLAWSRRCRSVACAGSTRAKARAMVQRSVRASLRERRESISIW